LSDILEHQELAGLIINILIVVIFVFEVAIENGDLGYQSVLMFVETCGDKIIVLMFDLGGMF